MTMSREEKLERQLNRKAGAGVTGWHSVKFS